MDCLLRFMIFGGIGVYYADLCHPFKADDFTNDKLNPHMYLVLLHRRTIYEYYRKFIIFSVFVKEFYLRLY